MKKIFLFLIFVLFAVGLYCVKESIYHREQQDVSVEESRNMIREEQDVSEEAVRDEKCNVYNNPIDDYYMPIIKAKKKSEIEIRVAQDNYKTSWMQEFEHLMGALAEKCIYAEDTKNIITLKEKIKEEAGAEIQVIKTELIDSYGVNPNPKKNDNVTRNSLSGNGTRSRLNQIEGEIYRDACIRIMNIYGLMGEYEYAFDEEAPVVGDID